MIEKLVCIDSGFITDDGPSVFPFHIVDGILINFMFAKGRKSNGQEWAVKDPNTFADNLFEYNSPDGNLKLNQFASIKDRKVYAIALFNRDPDAIAKGMLDSFAAIKADESDACVLYVIEESEGAERLFLDTFGLTPKSVIPVLSSELGIEYRSPYYEIPVDAMRMH